MSTGSPSHSIPSPQAPRLAWIDAMKGISILWIVFYHYFDCYNHRRYPSPITAEYFQTFFAQFAPSTPMGSLICGLKSVFLWVLQQGYFGVGVFVVLSGFGLSYSLTKTGGPTGGNWWTWYKKRILRLFPMYWLAHIIYLVSPFQAKLEPVDYRFFLSFLGDRVYPIYTMFFYLNPAWWFFGLLLQLYLICPLLFRLLQKIGPVWFLLLCGAATFGTRLAFLTVYPVSDNLEVGFCICRLWEFACGMALASLYRQKPEETARQLFGWPALFAGIVLFAGGFHCYRWGLGYAFVAPLCGTGLFLIVARAAKWLNRLPVAGAVISSIGAYSYGLFLLHQPYTIHMADLMKDYGLSAALGAAVVFVTCMTLLTMPVEKFLNKLTSRLLDSKKGVGAPAAASPII